jgi:hypothetical protein
MNEYRFASLASIFALSLGAFAACDGSTTTLGAFLPDAGAEGGDDGGASFAQHANATSACCVSV